MQAMLSKEIHLVLTHQALKGQPRKAFCRHQALTLTCHRLQVEFSDTVMWQLRTSSESTASI